MMDDFDDALKVENAVGVEMEVEVDTAVLVAWRIALGRKEATLPERERKSDIVAIL